MTREISSTQKINKFHRQIWKKETHYYKWVLTGPATLPQVYFLMKHLNTLIRKLFPRDALKMLEVKISGNTFVSSKRFRLSSKIVISNFCTVLICFPELEKSSINLFRRPTCLYQNLSILFGANLSCSFHLSKKSSNSGVAELNFKASNCLLKHVNRYLNSRETCTKFKSSGKRFPRLKVISYRLNQVWFIHLADMQQPDVGVRYLFLRSKHWVASYGSWRWSLRHLKLVQKRRNKLL